MRVFTTPDGPTIWALSQENLSSGVCEQHMRRPACASTQSDQLLCYLLVESILCKLATGEFSENPEDRFSCYKAHLLMYQKNMFDH